MSKVLRTSSVFTAVRTLREQRVVTEKSQEVNKKRR